MGQPAIAPSIIPLPEAVNDPLVEIIGHLGAAIMQMDKNHDPFIFRADQSRKIQNGITATRS